MKRLDLHVTIPHSHCCCIEVSLMQLMHKSAQAEHFASNGFWLLGYLKPWVELTHGFKYTRDLCVSV